ncbi:MarR family transcriptional regulator [Phenylobacterium sp. 20VBR1]|uniref:MarR family transcriptional regulator n=1 Tax=Phenylobacterium glaciei TaxID=2803784 RepID=A0A941HUS9_9CAUL|nr:MarR family transcriptional regulator [Phenylobacterium glaciei]MBR7617928.1 MarR family transcriptional regulator [Phenylobacterium glaciei]QQZ50528.1 MarR family transcriptional regulator [Phenylobacterium glaciei]
MSLAPPTVFVFFNEIAIIEHLSRTAFERVLPRGLSLAGFTVLNHLIRLDHGRRAPAQIASALQVTRGAITGTLKRLESQGLVSIAPDPTDGRGKGVSVTAAGCAARDAAIAALDPVFAELLGSIAETDLQQLLPTLQRVRQILDAARD